MRLGRVDQIKADLEAEGCIEGTPEFEMNFLERKVEVCQQLQAVGTCQECKLFDSCELVREYLTKLKYGPKTGG